MKAIPHLNKGFPWKPWKGEWKTIRLPREAGQTPPMTWEEFRKKHPKK